MPCLKPQMINALFSTDFVPSAETTRFLTPAVSFTKQQLQLTWPTRQKRNSAMKRGAPDMCAAPCLSQCRGVVQPHCGARVYKQPMYCSKYVFPYHCTIVHEPLFQLPDICSLNRSGTCTGRLVLQAVASSSPPKLPSMSPLLQRIR